MRVALASMMSNIGRRSPGELEMTCSTSEVAVCCCRDSRSSLSRRAFSMAIGLLGKIADQLDLLVGERSDLLAVDGDRADQLVFLKHGHSDVRPRAAELRRIAGLRLGSIIGGVGQLPCLQDAGEKGPGFGAKRSAAPLEFGQCGRRVDPSHRA